MNAQSPSSRPSETSGEPTVAALLSWIVPGAGHLYLGRQVPAIVGFVVVAGLYFLGLSLSGGMGFEFLHEELRGALAPALSPELGFLGGLVFQMKSYGFGPGYPRAFPDFVYLGTALTAAAGVLNLCLTAQAHHDARRARGTGYSLQSPGVVAALAWFVPGLGHLVQGRRLRAALVFLAIVGLVVLGSQLADGANLSRERHFYYWGGQFLAGLPALLLEFTSGHPRITGDIPYAEGGLVIAAIGGLLNILAMLDVYAVAEVRAGVVAPRSKSAAPEVEKKSVESLRLQPGEQEVSA